MNDVNACAHRANPAAPRQLWVTVDRTSEWTKYVSEPGSGEYAPNQKFLRGHKPSEDISRTTSHSSWLSQIISLINFIQRKNITHCFPSTTTTVIWPNPAEQPGLWTKSSSNPLARSRSPALPLQTFNKRIPTWHNAQILQIEPTINTQEALRAAEIPALPRSVLLPNMIFKGFSIFLWKSMYSLWSKWFTLKLWPKRILSSVAARCCCWKAILQSAHPVKRSASRLPSFFPLSVQMWRYLLKVTYRGCRVTKPTDQVWTFSSF